MHTHASGKFWEMGLVAVETGVTMMLSSYTLLH